MPTPDLSKYAGREQAYVKHYLLEKYLRPFVYKISTRWDSIVYIDGFAGPWEVTDPKYADSSFSVAIETLKQVQNGLHRRVHMEAILVEEKKNSFSHLNAFAVANNTSALNVHALCGRFTDKISAINQIVQNTCQNPFRFVFLDPKGWSDIPMKALQPFLKDRSCEVLINLMTRHIIRFLDEDDRATSYHNLFGRTGVLERLRGVKKENNERADQAVREYCRSLRDLCQFKYVSSAVILEPSEESVRYFLVYATNNSRGIEVFKQAEIAAARIQDDIRNEALINKTKQPELLLDTKTPKSRMVMSLRSRYLKRGRDKVLRILKNYKDGSSIKYEDLFCEAMAFPLVAPNDLISWIDSWKPNIELRLSGPKGRKVPSPNEDDHLFVHSSATLI